MISKQIMQNSPNQAKMISSPVGMKNEEYFIEDDDEEIILFNGFAL